ncbi:RidA family protein [Vagococcus carniphilus]|uniref:RidA family protein n=1 Tax=Vagococcus carniphilus TaxID=218144 RepID=UPI003BAA6FD3
MKKTSNPMTVHSPVGPYVHQVINTGMPLKWVTLSGQIGMTKEGDIPETGAEQFKLALSNVKANLKAAEMEVKHMTKLTIFLVDEIDLEIRKECLASFLEGEETAMTLLYIKALANPKLKVEIEAVACK